MPAARLRIEQINTFDQTTFVRHLGFVFEKTPWIAAEAWRARPFRSTADLHRALCAVLEAASEEQKIALIRAHPDLAGKAAIAGDLTAESTREQASAALNRLSPDEFATFTRLNDAYRSKFGFPFVICVREHTKASILAAFVDRLEHARAAEVETAVGEIAKIARLRLHDAVED
ncbi:MAG: OHCU decarboxylase [Chloroflexi bacterium]|nr:MAG: OHCU decarboxylase [Chloroflexota bacterium]